MSQKTKRDKLTDMILQMGKSDHQSSGQSAAATSQPVDPARLNPQSNERITPSGHGIVATALDLHQTGLKERLAALEESTNAAIERGDYLQELAPDVIEDRLPADRHQRFSDDRALDELARSIEVHGQHVPILVRRHPKILDRFEIAAGRRRLEACRRLQRMVLARVLMLDDDAMIDLQYRENAERSDVTMFERARWFQAVQKRFELSSTALAKRFELSQSMMVEYLKMARLPEAVIEALEDPRELTIAHTRKIYGMVLRDPNGEAMMVRALKAARTGLGTKTQLTRALASLSEVPKSALKKKARIVHSHEGKTLLTVTRSGRQTVFRWAPDIDDATIDGIADELPNLIARHFKP